MTAAITVINSDDDLIETSGNAIDDKARTFVGISVANLTRQFVPQNRSATGAEVSSASLARRSLMMYDNATATVAAAATATAATTTATMDVVYNTNNNNNFSLNPSSFVYVAAAAQENNSYAYEETLEPDVINRTLLLGGSGGGGGGFASATADTAPRSLDAAEWSHFYDLMLSWQGISLIAVFCTFIVITIIGNTLVILAVITTRRLKTITNCFVMSLAVADLLVGIFVMPPAVAVHLIGSWELGLVLCDIWISLDVLLCTASILSLCAISMDRYLAVSWPLTYSRNYRSKRLALSMILGVWLLALIITCPPMLGWKEQGHRGLKECRYNKNRGYVIYSAVGSFFLPMAVIVYAYASISCVVATRHDNMTDISVHNKKFKRYTSADVENDIDHDLSEQELSSSHKKQAAARTFSNQTIAKELHEVLMSEGGENGGGGGGAAHCHSLLTLSTNSTTTMNTKNGCYELKRPSSLRRTPTAASMMTSACGVGIGGGLEPQHCLRQHSQRHNMTASGAAHHHHQHLSAPAGTLGGCTSPQLLETAAASSAASAAGTMRQTKRGGGGGGGDHHHHHHKSLSNRITSLKKKNKTAQTLTIVVVGFIGCWLPFFIYYLMTPFLAEHQVSRTLANVLTWLGWVNSAINPFIYAFYSVDFRAAFWRLTCKRFFASSKPQFPMNTMSIRR